MLFTFLSLLALLAQLALANHSKCSWQPFTNSPAYNRYYLWCMANYQQTAPGQGYYTCADFNSTIADYGKLRSGVLEWGTPCGRHGYGRDPDSDQCDSRLWALCTASSCETPAPCLYMNQADDCEWPTLFNDTSVPKSLELWASFTK